MIKTNSMANASGEDVAIEIVARTVLNGVGTVGPGQVHTVPASVARLLVSLGKAKPAPVVQTRKGKSKAKAE